jgi:diguanylate cyclase (GGDEF)-like protein
MEYYCCSRGIEAVAVVYTQTLSTDFIVSEIEKMMDWQNDVLRQCFFAAAQNHKATADAPRGILEWVRQEQEKNNLDKKILERMTLVHDELVRVAGNVLKHSDESKPMTVELFDAFEHQCEAYVTQIRRLQQDLADSAVAVDTVTGLRTVAGMKNEIKREQDRFDRKGTAFSVAAIAVDNVEELLKKYDRRHQEVIFAHAAKVITRTIRSFDDAYYLGKGEFVLVLKHVEFMDACSVMDRLRHELEDTPVQLVNGDTVRVTGSFGIAEALQKESADSTIEHAKAALLDARGRGGNRVAEYRELSALAQYARDVAGGKKE